MTVISGHEAQIAPPPVPVVSFPSALDVPSSSSKSVKSTISSFSQGHDETLVPCGSDSQLHSDNSSLSLTISLAEISSTSSNSVDNISILPIDFMASSRKSRWTKQRAKIKARKAEEKRKEQTPSFASALPNSAITECEEIVESKLCDLAVELNAMPGLTEEVSPTTDKHSRKRVLKVGEIETNVMESIALQLRISDQQHPILNEKPSITFRDVQAPSVPPEDKKQTKVGRSRRGGKSARKRATLQSQGRNDRDTRRGTEADPLSVSSGATTRMNLSRVSEKEKSHEIHDSGGRSQIISLALEEPSSSIISASDAHSSIDR